ncbi:hypothetical protein ZWY2020_026659 [Hordeum vulgare]|nr:hypothetical protein ZWY2020_026659 [Hordeum vulgare]
MRGKKAACAVARGVVDWSAGETEMWLVLRSVVYIILNCVTLLFYDELLIQYQIKPALLEATSRNRRSTAIFLGKLITGTCKLSCNILIVRLSKLVTTMPANLGSWFGPTVSTVITPLKDVFLTHAMYCFSTGKNVRDHDRATKTLIGIQKGIQGEIEAGIQNGLIGTNEAKFWLERANKAISEEQRNHQRYDSRCRIFACCSLNCWTVTDNQPPPFVIDIPVQFAQLPSHEKVLLDAQKYIDDDRVGMIGLWGPDGVENTYLLKKINNSFVGDSPYFVIFVTASRECSVQNIQDQIIQRLDIGQDDGVSTKTTSIAKLLRTRNFLVLVDDLHEKLDLLEVGIPYPLGTVGEFKRKVVLTSQSEIVHSRMGVNEYIEVPGLGETEALELFKHNFDQEDIYYDPHIGPLVNDLIKELKGIPSDLIEFGKQMQGKRGPEQWEDVIRSVKKWNLQKKDPSSTGRTLRNLEDATNNLLARSNDVRLRIVAAERQCMRPTNEVNRWLEKVSAINSDIQVIFDGYKLNKDVIVEASEKLTEVQECISACPNKNNITFEYAAAPAQEIPGPSMSHKNRNLQEALQFIKNDPVGMIGIWGPGGVGKTYLLRNINNSFGDMSLHVIFVTASRGCSVRTIQGDILKKLGMAECGDLESQRQLIYEFLSKRSFLVLLDDLWEQIDLQSVGVPYPLGNVDQVKRKVVLTTRLRKVCGEMEVRKELKVACLQEDDAWQLFTEKVSQKTLSSSPRIETLAKELVKELKGLPLALIVIGKAMYPKTDPIEWEYAIQHMQRSCCDKDNPLSIENVFGQLKFSYDNLRNDTLRHCFLTCALWPENWEIIKAELAQCWIGLGLVDECDIQSAYTKAYSLIGDLRDACLLENWGNWYGFVKVHDVIRDMALWISCGCGEANNKWFVRAEAGAEKNISISWSKPEYISLMLNGMKKLPPFRFDHHPMKLRVLCLQNNYFDGSIAETVMNFSSLTYLDLRTNLLKNIPEELCSLANLEYFDLSHNPHICELPYCFRNLSKLKFLYLLCTSVRRIPEEVISNLKALQVIELRTCRAYVGGGPVNFIPKIFEELGTLDHFKSAGIDADGFDEYASLREAAKLPIRSLRLGSLRETHEFCLSDILSIRFARRTLYELDIIQSNMEQIIVRDESNYYFGALNKLLM